MTKATLYSAKTKTKTQVKLPKNFDEEVNSTLLAQAVRVYEDRLHRGTHKTKTRGEITLSTRKIYRQKGTGLARHGAKSAPLFVGGSKAHGPKKEKRTLTLSKKLKRKSLDSAFSMKASEDSVVLVNGISGINKTKDAAILVKRVKEDKKIGDRLVLVALSEKNRGNYLYFRNIKNLTVVGFENLNAYLVYKPSLILIDNDQFKSTTSNKTKKEVKTK